MDIMSFLLSVATCKKLIEESGGGNTPKFTIVNLDAGNPAKVYNYDKGMTFSQWCNSAYNTDGWFVDTDSDMVQNDTVFDDMVRLGLSGYESPFASNPDSQIRSVQYAARRHGPT